MIKKTILKLLLILMAIAFLAVVVVQLLWIKYAVRERQNQFTTNVYESLNRVVNRVEEINYMKYMREMQHHLGTLKSYQDLFAQQNNKSDNIASITSGYLQNVLNNDVTRLIKESNSMASGVVSMPSRMGASKKINQQFIMETIRSLSVPNEKNDKEFYNRFSGILKDFLMRVVKEKDPQNVDISQRLADIEIESMLKSYLSAYRIDIPFKCEIITKSDLLKRVYSKQTEGFYYVNLFPYDYVEKNYFLSLQFDSVEPMIYKTMNWMIIASGFCIFGILAVFMTTIIIIMRQQKLSVIKNDFINNMTHEFKTPIATISLATSAITKEKVLNNREQLLKFNEMIKNENIRMNKYVERILQQAKIDRQEFQLNKQTVGLNSIVKEAVGHFMLQVQERQGILTCRCDEKDDVIEADEVHMMNVVCNLIDNSIKYSKDKPEIAVSTFWDERGFVIKVEDNGIGIAKEDQRKVFKRFYRVSTGNLHNVKGFGLGLSYAKSIAEMHGATITLHSKKDHGTTVEIVFLNK